MPSNLIHSDSVLISLSSGRILFFTVFFNLDILSMLWRVGSFLTQYLSISLLENISCNHVEMKDSPYSLFT